MIFSSLSSRSRPSQLILLSTGFDTLLEDVGNHGPLSPSDSASAPGLDLTLRDVSWVTRKLQEVADMCCNGRIISVLEGGYGSRAGPSPTPPLFFGRIFLPF